MVDGEEVERSEMAALAVLTCQPNSHPFQERHISLHESVKIGRSVARARPAPNNGIFDCKVLSRNHAMLWYENGNFYIQDTKSSNGTFVNDHRLCKGGEESQPHAIYSEDIIQFGVNVMENNRRGEKITHGCIIAVVTLFHPDGREAKPQANQLGELLPAQELYQLSHLLQEAMHREKMLEQKLNTLQELVQNTQESSEGGWQALIDEDRLLSRLEVLENQLHAFSKNHTEDTLRQELVTLQQEKLNYETTAKESLMKVLQEKLEAVRKLSDLERSLTTTEEECAHLRETCEKTKEELHMLAIKYEDQQKEVQELEMQLEEAKNKHKEELDSLDKEKEDLNYRLQKLGDMVTTETSLTVKMESLQAENDIAKEQLAVMKAKLEAMKENNHDDRNDNKHIVNGEENHEEKKGLHADQEVFCPDIIPTSTKDQMTEQSEEILKDTQDTVESYKAKIEETEKRLKDSNEKIEQLEKELEVAHLEARQYLAKMATMEEKLKLSDLHMNQMVENTMADLNIQLKESRKQIDSSTDLIKSLQNQVQELETELAMYKIPQLEKSMNATLVQSAPPDEFDGRISSINHINSQADDDLEALLREARELQKKAEIELSKSRKELDESRDHIKAVEEERVLLKSQLTDVQFEAKDKSAMVIDLQDQLKKAEITTREVKEQILDLRDRLLEEQDHVKATQEHVVKLQNELEEEKSRHRSTLEALEAVNSELEETRSKHKITLEDLQDTKTGEFSSLKEECACLRKRIQAIEAEMKMSRRENLHLSAEYNKLQESYKELEALKEKLENNEMTWRSNMTDAQKETEKTQQELENAQVEIKRLQGQIHNMAKDYRQLANRSKVLSFCSSIPLLMLLFAILLALYPYLEQLTATAL
ncbi:hypothetical protein CHS0354_007339 [Potamilus streckersoni]|uniref:Sarcolemmal membrane-associated protein n=1 Tax=Potamilus streckersoni TaxID=2493646 RepID=A0AAE0TGN4_9BIVA|nr:hypothetical protein CHS0354_007339 [Potamilus streckersoni]